MVLGEGFVELASDIELHAEKIRRERNAKRAKQQAAAEAEAALTARGRTDVGAATAVVTSTTPGVPGTGRQKQVGRTRILRNVMEWANSLQRVRSIQLHKHC